MIQNKILVVDDEQNIRNMMKIFLSEWYEVYTAKDGKEGLDLVRTLNPEVVLTDLKMPVMNGIEMLRQMRAESFSTPVILMSAHGELTDAIEAMRLEAWDFLIKPMELDVVKEKIDRAYKYSVVSYEKKEIEDILETINDAITLHDKDLNIVRVNRAALELLGKDDVDGRKCYELFHNTDKPPLCCPSCEALRSHKTSKSSFFEPALGKYLEITAIPRLNKKMEVIGIVHIVRDITENQEAQKIKSEFLANMSHELRTPLNGILGIADLMMDIEGLTKEQHEYIEIIKRSGDNLLKLVEQLLSFSKINTSNIDFEKVVFNVERLVRTVVNTFKDRAEEKDLDLKCTFDANLQPTIIGDPGKVREALLYLIDNAIKFTNKGCVSVNVSMSPYNELLLNVIDTGIGISPEMQSLIFKDFVQANGSITRKFGGTGSGLSLAYRLITSMCGKITCRSVEGAGSVFYITLPMGTNTTPIGSP